MKIIDRLRLLYHRGSVGETIFMIWFTAALIGTVIGMIDASFIRYGVAYLGISLVVLFVGLQAWTLWGAWQARRLRSRLKDRLWLDFNQMDAIPIDAPMKTWGKLTVPSEGFPYKSPLNGIPCLWWAVNVEYNDDEEKWVQVDYQSSGDHNEKQSFWIEQQGNSIEVRLSQIKGESLDSIDIPSRVSHTSKDPKDLERLPHPLKAHHLQWRSYRITESVADNKEDCYVIIVGASGQDSGGSRFLHSSKGVPLQIVLAQKPPVSETELDQLLFKDSFSLRALLFALMLPTVIIGSYLLLFYLGLS